MNRTMTKFLTHMKRIAIPVFEGKLSQQFGQCSHFLVYEIGGNSMKHSELKLPFFDDLSELPDWTARQGITDIIAHKIDQRIISRFISNKINLFIGVRFDTPQVLIEDYINGRLTSDGKIIREITESIN